MSKILAVLAGIWVGLVSTTQGAEAPFLWVEGENATRKNIHPNPWFDAVDPAELSGGAQVASFSEPNQPTGWVEFDIDFDAGGAYHFWLRANLSSGISYKVGQSPFKKLDVDVMLKLDHADARIPAHARRVQQQTNVAIDGLNDSRTMTWYNLGVVNLSQGKTTFRFSLGGDEPSPRRFAAIDCFVLTKGLFVPRYHYKPGQKPTAEVAFDPDKSWAFTPKRDPLSSNALFDLRSLNETVAGEHGFIKLSPDGNSFVRGDGQPIRFWGGTTWAQRIAHQKKDQTVLTRHAKFLAKRGVNIVRFCDFVESKQEGSRVTDVDEKTLDELYRLVAEMKKTGIYTIISPFWPVHARLLKSWGVADSGNGSCTGLLFFDPVLQQGYKAWLRRIYADKNPYTGVPLAKDPAVAMIQLQNEDSLLFWSMQSIKGQALKDLRKRYGDWLLKKYGSAQGIRDAWRGCSHPDDDRPAGSPGLFIVWELTQEARNMKGDRGGRAERMADQAEFLGRLMFDFNHEIARYLRDELGCQQIINAGNWRTADQVILDDVERWSYSANEVIGKNHYFGGIHNGINSGWQFLPGQVFTSKSFITDPINSPLSLRQVAGHPFIISESLWVPPNLYASEGPLIVAAQSCLTGLDIFFWFATNVEDWQPPGMKWTFAEPMTLGQFPAAASIFRNGYVREGPIVIHEERRLQDIWERKAPVIAEGGAWDPNRDAGGMPTGMPFRSVLDPLAYLVGRVEVQYGGEPAKSSAVDLTTYIDPARKRVRSVTGEIETDLTHGIYRIDTPRAQAVAGMLGKAGRLTLKDTMFAALNDYACVSVVSLDGKPLATSARMLVQIGTTARPTGWKEKPMRISTKEGSFSGSRILEAGGPPWRIEKMRGALAVRNPSITRATALDPNGMPTSDIPIWRGNGEIRISLPSSALYVCLRSSQE